MKAVNEIGIGKLIKFFIFSVWELCFNCLIFSPLRIFWLRLFGAEIGQDVIFGKVHFMNLYRRGIKGLKIGDRCFIGDGIVFDLADEIIVGDDCTLSEECFMLTHTNVGYQDHPLQKYFPGFTAKVVIGDGCFIGIRATIMPGVILGEKSAVGACSFVNHNVPSQELHAGVPAKIIRKLS